MVLDVNSPLYGGYIDRTDPASTYNAQYFHQVYGIIEAFKNYPNTLAFFAGNEIINEQSVKEIPAYIRVCLNRPQRLMLNINSFTFYAYRLFNVT